MNNQVLNHQGNKLHIEAFHLGSFLLEETEERLLQKNVALALSILPHYLNKIFAGKRNISAHLALPLEKLLGISSHYWLSLQMKYDLFQARQQEELA